MSSQFHTPVEKSNIQIHTSLDRKKETAQPVNTSKTSKTKPIDPKFNSNFNNVSFVSSKKVRRAKSPNLMIQSKTGLRTEDYMIRKLPLKVSRIIQAKSMSKSMVSAPSQNKVNTSIIQINRLGNRLLHPSSQLHTTVDRLQGKRRMIQRMVSESATFPLKAVGGAKVVTLDSKILEAEKIAIEQLKDPNAKPTRYQANYKKNSSPMTWGYVIEEQLDGFAKGLGWNRQGNIGGARPDYYMDIVENKGQPARVYADLTTQAQAGAGGDHITEKLIRGKNKPKGKLLEAADITHQGEPNNKMPPLQVPQDMNHPEKKQTWTAYHIYVTSNKDLDYIPDAEEVIKKHKKPTTYEFYYVWTPKQREDLINDAQSVGITMEAIMANEESDGSESEDNDIMPL